MMHSRFKSLLWVAVAAIAFVPMVAMTQVYKCGTAGHVAYQDSPCKGAPEAAPYIVASSPAGGPSASSGSVAESSPAAGPGDDLDSIYVEAELAKGEQQRLQMQSDKEVTALRIMMKGASPDVARQAEQALSQGWAHRLEAANLHEAQLVAKLHRLCPGGFDLNSRNQTCLPAATPTEPSTDLKSSTDLEPSIQPEHAAQAVQPEKSSASSE